MPGPRPGGREEVMGMEGEVVVMVNKLGIERGEEGANRVC